MASSTNNYYVVSKLAIIYIYTAITSTYGKVFPRFVKEVGLRPSCVQLMSLYSSVQSFTALLC